jgi:hypothetical protein
MRECGSDYASPMLVVTIISAFQPIFLSGLKDLIVKLYFISVTIYIEMQS